MLRYPHRDPCHRRKIDGVIWSCPSGSSRRRSHSSWKWWLRGALCQEGNRGTVEMHPRGVRKDPGSPSHILSLDELLVAIAAAVRGAVVPSLIYVWKEKEPVVKSMQNYGIERLVVLFFIFWVEGNLRRGMRGEFIKWKESCALKGTPKNVPSVRAMVRSRVGSNCWVQCKPWREKRKKLKSSRQ